MDEIVRRYGQRVGFSEEEMARVAADPVRLRHLRRLAEAARRWTIVAEVVGSRHCNSGHEPGQRLYLDTDGNLIAKLCPKRMCVYLVSQLAVPVALINERLSEGLEPGDFHFMRQARCPDAGVECQGFGEVRLEVRVEPRQA
jgi:hypothetical protein